MGGWENGRGGRELRSASTDDLTQRHSHCCEIYASSTCKLQHSTKPISIAKVCSYSALPSLRNGRPTGIIINTDTVVGAQVTFTCINNFRIAPRDDGLAAGVYTVSTQSVTCQADGTFTALTKSCVCKYQFCFSTNSCKNCASSPCPDVSRILSYRKYIV